MTLATTAVLSLGDVVTTALGQSAGLAEQNPITRHVLVALGLGSWAGGKLAFFAVLWLVVLLAPLPALPRIRLVVQAANVAMAFVVLSNVGLLIRG